MKNLQRVIRALELDRARESEQFRSADERRAELERQLDEVDGRLRSLEEDCRARDVMSRMVADAAARRLQVQHDRLAHRMDDFDREELEPARARLLEANVRVSTVELLVERRAEVFQREQARRQQDLLDEFGAHRFGASKRFASN